MIQLALSASLDHNSFNRNNSCIYCISKNDFAFKSIQRIGGASFKIECDMLMSSELDGSYREVYVSFAQQEQRLEKVEEEYNKIDEELKSAKEKICQLEEIKDNTKGSCNLHLE